MAYFDLSLQTIIDKAIASVSHFTNRQDIVDKISIWQAKKDEWCLHTYKHIKGHRFLKTSSYSEANHGSLTAKIPDSNRRQLEEFVAKLVERKSALMEEHQRSLYDWENSKVTAIERMKQSEKSDLGPARTKLHKVPFERFAKRYAMHREYNAEEVTDGSRTGVKLTHR